MVLVRLSLALTLAGVLAAAPALAQTVEADQVAGDAIVAIQSEVLVLVELDAFDEVPPALDEIHSSWVEYTDGFTRDDLLQWLYETDADGSALLDRLTAAPGRQSAATVRTLGLIGTADRVLLESGRTIGIPPGDYVAALEDLAASIAGTVPTLTDGAVPAAPSTVVSRTSVTAPDRFSGNQVAADAASGTAGAAAAYPWIAVSLALVGVLVLGAVMILVGRRRSLDQGAGQAFDRLFEAERLMTSALDRSEVVRIGVAEAVALTEARDGAFVAAGQEGLLVVHQTGDVVDDRCLADGLLARVAATGSAARTVSPDEPALNGLPEAVLAVPVIGRAGVCGIVLVVGPPDAPFTEDQEDLVGRLAPMIGSALVAADTHDDITELTRTDALTGLANRRSFDSDLRAALVELEAGASHAVVMIDVDHFEHFNDSNGHAAGDQALCAVAAALRAHVRGRDVAYRYGGEEFSLLLRHATLGWALEVCRRVRMAVEAIDIIGANLQPGGRLTISLGIAMVSGGDLDTAIGAAEAALHEAKALGRNRIVVAEHPVSVV